MRRYIPSLMFIVVLLVGGGFALYNQFSPAQLVKGYVPTLNAGEAGQMQALMLVGGIVGGLVMLCGMGAGLAFLFYYLPTWQARLSAPRPAQPARAEAPAKPAAKAGGTGAQPPSIPLSDSRSLMVFWILLVVFLAVFLAFNYAGAKVSPLPSLNVTVLKLPGEHVEGLPEWIAGPGDEVKAWQLLVAVLGGAIVGTIVIGFALARTFDLLEQQVKVADKAPRTMVDRLLAGVEARLRDLLSALKAPRPPRPVSYVDRLFVALNLVLFLALVYVVAAYVVPTLSTVASVNTAIEATKLAALWTPTPVPTATTAPVEALQAELEALPKGDPEAGQATFTTATCVACHSLEPNVTLVGPSQAGIATRAATRKPGYSAELYIYESITNPNAYIVEGFVSPSLMPTTFKDTLKPQEIADLIAFLMTLR